MSDLKVCPTCGTEYPLSERFCPRDGTALRSANAQGDLLGSVVADRYHILKKLGEGGMGTVYLAEHVKMGRKSALKVMNPGMNTDPDAIARFNREAANASRLSHPNICGIYDFGETPDGLIYLAMEFIEGQSLSSLVERGGMLPPPRAASIVHQTADALQVAHDAGIVHRDLKPDNIMVAKHRDGSDLVKVVDFGIAKASSSEAQKVTRTGLVVGTPEYMSPEQLAGDKLDGRSDIYSLGLVAFNCLTGSLPFAADSAQESMIMRLTEQPRRLTEVRPEIAWPESLQSTLDSALARDAGARYQSAAQFGREFAAAIAEMPAGAAAEAGTLVLGQIPSTRVARPKTGDAASAVKGPRTGAPPATRVSTAVSAPRRRVAPMAFGGLGSLAVIAGIAWMGLAGGANSATSTAPADPTTLLPATPESGATKERSALPSAAKKTADVSPETSASAGTRPLDDGRSPNTPAMKQMRAWVVALNEDGVSRATAQRVLDGLDPLRRQLAGAALAESHYVAMIAYTALEDGAAACEEARLVKQLHSDAARISLAEFVIGKCS